MESFNEKAIQIENNIKKTKEQKQREKRLNNSLLCLSKSTQQSLGIISMQCDDGVFYLENDVYLKVYSLKFKSLSSCNRNKFIKKLCDSSFCRMRLSSFVRNSGDIPEKILRFLTVYVNGRGYAAAYDEFEKIGIILSKISEEFEVKITPCSINNVLTIIHMNISGEVKNYDINALVKQKEDLKKVIFPDMKEDYNEFQVESSLYGISYNGTEFSNTLSGVYEYFEHMKYDIQSCVDIQVMTREETEIFNYNLKRRYNHVLENNGIGRNVNLTFLLSVTNVSSEEREEVRERLRTEKSMLLIPCTGNQITAYSSICSLGLVDYHIMRNQQEELIGKLFL